MTIENRDHSPSPDPSGTASGESRSSTSGETPAEPTTRRQRSKARRSKRKPLPIWQETLLLLGIALVLAIVIKALFVQAFYIPSVSMEPGLVKNDRILVEKVSYWTGGPGRGDVVVFEDPGGWLGPTETVGPSGGLARGLELVGLYPSGGHLVKRVIGVGGDTVECCDRQGRLMVNGVPLNEKAYLPTGVSACESNQAPICRFTVEIPDDHLWVQGDNRPESADSRYHQGDPGGGFVPSDLVVGKVFALVWPADNARMVKRPDTFVDVPDQQ